MTISARRQAILDLLADDEQVIFFEPEGMDVAIIGLSAYQPSRPRCVIYAYHRLMFYFLRHGMDKDEAEEWMSYNVVGAWLGPTTPIIAVLSTMESR